MQPINLSEKLAKFSEHWSPKIVAAYNGNDIMMVECQGEFPFHAHAESDDFFLVLKGRKTIEMREGNVELGPGELFVVPKGVEQRPVAAEEAHVLLIEPRGEANTGDSNDREPATKQWI
jgi:mannose-6-phosphate isomerase-like protein (cupin superfamily)